jgi:hypothetical protein
MEARVPERADEAREAVRDFLRYQNGSPIEKIDIDIEQPRTMVGLVMSGGGNASEYQRQIAKLQKRKAELQQIVT